MYNTLLEAYANVSTVVSEFHNSGPEKVCTAKSINTHVRASLVH
jgi:hypothetical protein